MADLLDRVIEATEGFLQLGNEVVATEHATFVRNPACPDITDANHGGLVRAATVDEVESVLATASELFPESTFLAFKVDPRTPALFEARLNLDGFKSSADLQMLLTGPLLADPPPCAIREVASEDDWATIRRLKRLDDEDEATRSGRTPREIDVSRQMFEAKRAKSPDVRYFLASEDEVDCAFFSSWPGHNGVGVVEDLFTLPDFRRRGIATALIAHAVSDARERGATDVLIGADPADNPKNQYARLGFRPVCLFRGYWRDNAAREEDA